MTSTASAHNIKLLPLGTSDMLYFVLNVSMMFLMFYHIVWAVSDILFGLAHEQYVGHNGKTHLIFAAEFCKTAKKEEHWVLLLIIYFHTSTFRNHEYISPCGNVFIFNPALSFCKYHVG